MLKYINTWKLKRWQYTLLYAILNFWYDKKANKGDIIECFGIGYPHWKGVRFHVTAIFHDGTLGILNQVRVNPKDFKVIKSK